MNAPWLFAEAYKYRRLHECFSVSKSWKGYDVFYRQKVHTLSFPFCGHHADVFFSAILSPDQQRLSSSSQCDLLSHSSTKKEFRMRQNLKLSVSCS